MKKISKIIISMTFVLLFVLASAFSAAAYEPYDSDFVKVWDVAGEISVDEEGKAKLIFLGGGDKPTWAGRINYNEMVDVDGLELKLTNVVIDENSAPVMMFGNELGEWCDSPDAFMMAFYNVRSHETLGELEFGYFSVSKTCGPESPIFGPIKLENSLEGELTISFKKADDKWILTVNGQAIDLPADSFDYLIDSSDSFLNLGNYAFEEGKSLSYTVEEINQLDTGGTTPDPTTGENGETTKAPENGGTTKVPEATNAATTAAKADSESNDLVLYIVLGAVILVAVVVAAILIVKSKKK